MLILSALKLYYNPTQTGLVGVGQKCLTLYISSKIGFPFTKLLKFPFNKLSHLPNLTLAYKGWSKNIGNVVIGQTEAVCKLYKPETWNMYDYEGKIVKWYIFYLGHTVS